MVASPLHDSLNITFTRSHFKMYVAVAVFCPHTHTRFCNQYFIKTQCDIVSAHSYIFDNQCTYFVSPQADGNFTLKEVLSQKYGDFLWVFKIYVCMYVCIYHEKRIFYCWQYRCSNWNTVAGRNSYCIFWTTRHLSSWKMLHKILLHLTVWMGIEYFFPLKFSF